MTRYKTITIDPPWPLGRQARTVAPRQTPYFSYPTIKAHKIARMPIQQLADPNGCQVYLWTTQSTLPLGFELFRWWGVRYHCTLTWIKHVGMTPYSFMFSTEHVLFGRIGKAAPLREMGLRLEFYARATGHSRKPEAFFSLVERVSDAPRLEMFARARRPGWDAWGNEVASDITLVL